MTEDQNMQDDERTGASPGRVALFLTDPRTSTELLEETIAAFIADEGVDLGIIDLSTAAGLGIAASFRRAGLGYWALDLGWGATTEERLEEGPATDYDAAEVWGTADDTTDVEAGDLDRVAAVVVVVPAAVEVDPDGLVTGFSTAAMLGAIVERSENLHREIRMILPPGRGPHPSDGSELRRIIPFDLRNPRG